MTIRFVRERDSNLVASEQRGCRSAVKRREFKLTDSLYSRPGAGATLPLLFVRLQTTEPADMKRLSISNRTVPKPLWQNNNYRSSPAPEQG
jgi:hypothetical protein